VPDGYDGELPERQRGNDGGQSGTAD